MADFVGKVGSRTAGVQRLDMFLLWPVLLACVMVASYWSNLTSVLAYLAVVLLTCLTTAVLALFCSVVFRKTSISLMTTYLVIVVMFCAPMAMIFFSDEFLAGKEVADYVDWFGVTSPFCTAFAIPLQVRPVSQIGAVPVVSVLGGWTYFGIYVSFTLAFNALLLIAMIWLFKMRWRVAR